MREYSINVEENEKPKVTDNKEYITKLLEEKTQAGEQKQVITG